LYCGTFGVYLPTYLFVVWFKYNTVRDMAEVHCDVT
jgi:hypothetical protein